MSGIALISGASSGIGAAFARHLAATAAGTERYRGLPRFDELWLVARRGDRLADLAEELRKKYSNRDGGEENLIIRAVTLDLTESGALTTLKAKADGTGKRMSILINNAGYGSYDNFSDVDLDFQLGQIDINCRALTEACGRFNSLLEPGSLVINVASLAAFAPLGGFAVYAATKAYVLYLSLALSVEWAQRGITVTSLCPGPVDSEFSHVASRGKRKEVIHGWDVDKTVTACLRGAGKGKKIIVTRLSWKLQRLAAALLGPASCAALTYSFIRRSRGTQNSETNT